MSDPSSRRIAERVRAACIRTALEGYEAAAISGLCKDGAWEAVVDAMRMLDIAALVAEAEDDDDVDAADKAGV